MAKRRIECPECGDEVVIELRKDLNGPDIHCGGCGHRLTDNAFARSLGQNLSLEEAAHLWWLVREYTYDQLIDLARKGLADPASLTPVEIGVVMASLRLRAAGLPGHGSPKAN